MLREDFPTFGNSLSSHIYAMRHLQMVRHSTYVRSACNTS
jgi:hypothetical protein